VDYRHAAYAGVEHRGDHVHHIAVCAHGAHRGGYHGIHRRWDDGDEVIHCVSDVIGIGMVVAQIARKAISDDIDLGDDPDQTVIVVDDRQRGKGGVPGAV
jgi:hypothetical protein